MKVWVDGSGLGHTAATTGPDGRVRGSYDNDPTLLRQSIIDGHRAGWQVAAHAIGDAAVDLVLDALAEAADGGPYPVRGGGTIRHRIEHGVMIRPDQVVRLVDLGMSVVVQPLFVTEFGDALVERFAGEQVGENYFRMRSLADAGVHVVASSDRPVAEGSPLRGIQAMVERATAGGAVFGPDERLTVTEALECYTAAGARAAMRESEWGSLTARRVADLVVLDDDPTRVDPGRIGAIGVVATMVGGRAVHDPGSLFGQVGATEESGPPG
jgi:predicted amidohydrolase YtcJ